MFIIAKLTVHTLEDKQKKVSLSQFSTLPVTLKVVPCMTTTRGQHCSAPPRHRLNQISHIVSWYCSPFLLQHLAELIEGLRWKISLAHTFIQLIYSKALLNYRQMMSSLHLFLTDDWQVIIWARSKISTVTLRSCNTQLLKIIGSFII
jgi:hypothetical protein